MPKKENYCGDPHNPARTKIVWRNDGYYVNRPNFEGGEVVPAEAYDFLSSELKQTIAAKEFLRGEVAAHNETIQSLKTRNEGLQIMTKAARLFVDSFTTSSGYPGDGKFALTEAQYNLLVNLNNSFLP